MATLSSRGRFSALLRRNAALAVLLWSVVVGLSWWWSYNIHQQRLIALAKAEASTNINKDWAFRLWATSHGGVYVTPDDKTPPNPYLANIPERDVVTDKGRHLTLMNPAYMLRQIMQGYSDLYGVKGHITSLNLTNPINKPDAWEIAALKSFRQGVKETVSVAEIDGKPYLRMMRPIQMEQGCMKCHANLGIKVGEIRGGISTAIPMEPLYAAFKPDFEDSGQIHVMFWLLGVLTIIFIAWRAKRETDEIDRYQGEINLLNRDLEQRVASRTAELEAANKELEAFSYSVSHDLRTPLRAIDGFTGILLDEYADKLDDEGRRLLDVVRENTNRMGLLIDDLLKFSRTSRLEMNFCKIDMEKLAHEVFTEIQATAGGNLQMEIGAMPPATGDRSLMRQVLINLLTNAIKFSRTRETPCIKLDGFIDGDETIYYVQDNGVGFDMQYAGKLFGVFQRLHEMSEFEGTGIGLAIVKRIITRHGGRVWAEGKVGEGATIYFAIPNAPTGQMALS